MPLTLQGWAKDVDSGLSTATWTWIPPGFPGYDAEDKTLGYDVERAKKALADSTYDGPEALNALGLKLTFGDTPRNRQRTEWLVNNYKQNLGVDIALDPIEPTTFTAHHQGSQDLPAAGPPGLVRGLSGSAELAERVLEERYVLRAAPGLQERRA